MRTALKLFAPLVAALYRMYFATLRVRVMCGDGRTIRPQDYVFGSEMFAVCERDLLALAGTIVGHGIVTLVAPGRDGDWVSAAFEAIGCRTIRGATDRGGARALRQSIRELQAWRGPGCFVVDGPLGPAGHAKPGVLLCAAACRRPVVAVGAAARHQFTFNKTWSGMYLPLPFTEVAIVLQPFATAGTGDSAAAKAACRELTIRLAEARHHAIRSLPSRTRGRKGEVRAAR
jgi:lysophospholipid acyltransferase (LPLAT)-like uncharacterized protein